jgi:glycosyltransferase involved in cell wall biosynthesis
MNIIITHGYLLTGTGSNLYVNNLVRELCKKGHNIFLVCQEYKPMSFDYVNEYHSFSSDNTEYQLKGKKETEYEGTCIVFKPNLNGFLPVYVYDHYDGYEVKEFPNCTNEEVDRYIGQNRTALEQITKNYNIDSINTNHTVLFPHIVSGLSKIKQIKHYITVHGSALNFTVKKDNRFVAYAKNGFDSATKILVDSHHAEEELLEFLDDKKWTGLKGIVQIIPAGVDVSNFVILDKTKKEQLNIFKENIAEALIEGKGRTVKQNKELLYADSSTLQETCKSLRKSYDYRIIDQDIQEKIASIDENNPTILFVGKYLWTKGIYLILLAIPEILIKHPNAKFIFVGFGPFREEAEILINFLANEDIQGLKNFIQTTPFFKNNEGDIYPLLDEILNDKEQEIEKQVSSLQNDLRENVLFTGIISHKHLVQLLPAVDVQIAPSVFPEAFGMVAIEAMACGVSPILTYQSAFKEIFNELKEQIKEYQIPLKQVNLDSNASRNIAFNVNQYLESKVQFEKEGKTSAYKEDLRRLVVENYSWEGIATKYIKVFEKKN